MAIDPLDTSKYPVLLAYVGADGLPKLVSPSQPLPSGAGGGNPAGDGASNTGTSTQVASATSPTTILAANAARYGATVFNDDANTLYLLLGSGTVSATVYTVQVLSGDYFPVPYGFTGIITGLWAADGSGSARVTEFT